MKLTHEKCFERARRITSLAVFSLLIVCFSSSSQAFSKADLRTFLNAARTSDADQIRALTDSIPRSKINHPVSRTGGTLLHAVLQYGSPNNSLQLLAIINILVASGVDINRRDDNGRTAAFFLGQYPDALVILKWMAERGATIDDLDSTGRTLLHLYAGSGNRDVVDWLLMQGLGLEVKDRLEMTPLAEAVRRGRQDIMEQLLAAGADINTRATRGNGLLHFAAKLGNIQIVDFLVDNGLSVDQKDTEGKTALSILALAKKWSAVRILLERDADANVPMNKNSSVGQFIIMAPELGLSELVAKQKVDINAPSTSGYTPMFQALSEVDLNKINSLVGFGADVSNTGVAALPPIPLLAGRDPKKYPNLENVIHRVLELGGSINAVQNGLGYTAVMIAAENGFKTTVELLLDKGADLSLGRNHSRILQKLLRRGDYDLLLLLTSQGLPIDFDDDWLWRELGRIAQVVEQEELSGNEGDATRLFRTLFERKPIVNMVSRNRTLIGFERDRMANSDSILVLNSLFKATFHDNRPKSSDTSRPDTVVMPPPLPHRQYSSDVQLHVVGVYEGKTEPQQTDQPWWAKCQKGVSGKLSAADAVKCHRNMTSKHAERTIDISLLARKAPVVLALMAYEPTLWRINNTSGSKVEGVILAGYHGQRLLGLPQKIPLDVYTHKPSDCVDCQVGAGAFYAYKQNSNEFTKSVQRLKELTGLSPASFQGRYSGDRFSIRDR